MADNVDVIQGIWEAFARGDLDRAATHFADDAVLVAADPLPWGGTHVGPEGFRDFADLLGGQFKDMKARPLKVLGSDDNHVTVLAHTSGRTRAGKPLEVDVLWLYQLRDGRVVSAHSFADTVTILEALD
jgi:uncharacterized protein